MCPHILSHDGPSACMLHIRAEICRNQETRIYPCSTRCRFAPVSLASLHAWWLMAHWPEVNLAGGMPGHIGPLNGLAHDRACMLCLCLLGETLQWRHVDWTGVQLIPWVSDCESCLLLAEPFVVFKPAWSTMRLCLSDDEACISQHVTSLCVLCSDRNVGQETKYLRQWGINLPQAMGA